MSNNVTIVVPEADIPLRDVPSKVAEIYECEPVSRQNAYQWARNGRIAKNGVRIYLKTQRRLGRLHTTVEWIKDFVEAL